LQPATTLNQSSCFREKSTKSGSNFETSIELSLKSEALKRCSRWSALILNSEALKRCNRWSVLIQFYTTMKRILLCVHGLTSCAFGFIPNLSLIHRNKNPSLNSSHMRSQQVAVGASNQPGIIERLELGTKFGRWRFLQDTLEQDSEPQHVNEILYKVLKSFYDNPRPELTEEGKTNPSPMLTEEQRALLVNHLFQEEDSIGVIPILPPEDQDFTEKYTSTLDLLEKLHPDPIEDEDAFRSCWDILVELYGRESTKHAQMTGDVHFMHRSSAARLLLHFDFLTEGIGQ
jgi:hypothetical protein